MVDNKKSESLWWLWVVTAIGLLFRIIPIQTAISWDEAIIFFWVKEQSLSWIASYYENIGNHVLLTLLTALSYNLFGPDLWAIRIPALLAGVFLIPGVYFLAKEVTNERAARLATGIAAGLNFLILYSVNERGYGLQATLVIFMLLAWIRYWRRDRQWRYLLLSSGLLTLALYTLPTTLFVVPALALVALFLPPTFKEVGIFKKGWLTAFPILLSGLLTFLLYLPIILNAGVGGTLQHKHVKVQLTFVQSLGVLKNLSWELWNQSHWGIPDTLSSIIGGFILLGLIRSILKLSPIAGFTIGTASAVILALLVIQPAPVRAFVFFLPLGIIFLAYGVDFIVPSKGTIHTTFSSPLVAIGAALMIGSTSIYDEEMFRESSRSYGRERGCQELITAMAPLIQTGDYVEHVIPQMVYWMYRLNVPRFAEFNETAFLVDGKRIFVVVRHLRETLERVIKISPIGQLKELSLEKFEEPQFIGRYGDFDLYRYDLKESQ
jgi:4-amino-4-deoxy-L-arabinose transferase-like glycosyltransferase